MVRRLKNPPQSPRVILETDLSLTVMSQSRAIKLCRFPQLSPGDDKTFSPQRLTISMGLAMEEMKVRTIIQNKPRRMILLKRYNNS
jgi:hypothetical protein